MAIRIIVDSASDITPAEAEAMGIVHIPLRVSFDGQEFLDGVEINHTEFYNRLIESDVLPKTSQATPVDFLNSLKPIMEAGDDAIIITLSSGLSGTYQSACVAASEYEGRAFVVDSENVTVSERLLVELALKLIAEGKSAAEITDVLNKEKKRVCVLAVLDTLEYLKKGGRISAAAAFAGGVLSLKPVVTVKDGAVICIGKARGSKNGNNMLRKLLEEKGGIDFDMPYAVAYSGNSDHLLQKYIEDSADIWNPELRKLPIYTIGSAIGTHVGPGAIAVFFFSKQ